MFDEPMYSHLQHLHRHLCRRGSGRVGGQGHWDGRSGVRGPELRDRGLLLGLTPLLLLSLFSHQLLPQQHTGRHDGFGSTFRAGTGKQQTTVSLALVMTSFRLVFIKGWLRIFVWILLPQTVSNEKHNLSISHTHLLNWSKSEPKT